MAYTFVVSDESINSYGFRVLTDGIDLAQFKKNPIMLYMHQRNTYRPTGDEVIGRWENIRKEKGKLLADAVFDEANEFGKKIAEKVKGGFIKMASIGILKKETSTEKKHLKSGQTRATVTKSILHEISIVDMGGNDNALKLYQENGDDFEIETLNLNTTNNMKDLKQIAAALGLSVDSDETAVLSAIATLKLDKDKATVELAALNKKEEDAKKASAKKTVEEAAVKLKLEGDAKSSFETTYLSLFEADYDNANKAIKTLVAGIDTGKKAASNKTEQLGTFMKTVDGNQPATDDKRSFDYLQKFNPAELGRIRDNEPETYATLASEYAAGKRYNK